MSYFSIYENCHKYPDEWNRLLHHINTKWKPQYRAKLDKLEYPIELKAFYVFTLSRHLIERSEEMPKDGNWHPVFIEAMMLLFPMLEIVGQARLGDLTSSSLGAGISWLEDPHQFPVAGITQDQLKIDETRIAGIGAFMPTLPEGPRIRELFHIRNYFIHGLKNQKDSDFDIGAVRTSMNFEMPKGIISRSKECLALYWDQLTDNASSTSIPWIERLAKSDIYPFGIMGSTTYEQGMVDPDIFEWITKL